MVCADGREVQTYQTQRPSETFGAAQSVDAHMVCYTVEDESGPTKGEVPRITKSALAALDHFKGLDPEGLGRITRISGSILAVDFDLPEHVKWTDAHRKQVQELLLNASVRWPLLASPSLFYATSGGLRLMWFLSRPVDVRGTFGLEDLLHGLVATVYCSGFVCDPICRDWTRLFRLPRVTRADKPPLESQTWQQAYYAQSWGRIDFDAKDALPQGGLVLVHDPSTFRGLSQFTHEEFLVNIEAKKLGEKWKAKIGQGPRDMAALLQQVKIGDQPDDAQVQTLVAGSSGQTAAYKQATARLRSLAYPRDASKAMPEAVFAYRVIAEDLDMREESGSGKQLHPGITRLARALCLCFRERLGEGATEIPPQFLFSVIIQPARKANAKHLAEGQKARTDDELKNEVWRAVGWHYQLFMGTVLMHREEVKESEQDEADARLAVLNALCAHQESIIQTMLSWGSGYDDEKLKDHLRDAWAQFLMLSVDEGRCVLQVGKGGNISYSFPAKKWSDTLSVIRDCGHQLIPYIVPTPDGDKTAKEDDIVSRFSSMIEEMVYTRIHPHSHLRFGSNGKGDFVPTFMKAIQGIREDIPAVYDPQVDEWLTALGGKDVEELLNWLAAFPHISRPSCALYLQGASGIGKGMLGEALKNLTVSRKSAMFDGVLKEFQDTMAKTPFVWADEKVTTKRWSNSLMDTFKKLVTGEYDTINRKGKVEVQILGKWRVLITANHANALPWDEEVSGPDLDALRQRLIHVNADDAKCREILEQVGQRAGTDGWPERSIPQHIMWLAANRAVDFSSRFLVTATAKPYHEAMSITSGGTEGVVVYIGKMIADLTKYGRALQIKGDDLWAIPSNLLEVIDDMNDGQLVIPKTTKKLGQSLKHISVSVESEVACLHKAGRMLVPTRAWRLDVGKIVKWLYDHDENTDFREQLGALWSRVPQHIQDMHAGVSAPPPPPPPPAPLKAPRPPPAPPKQAVKAGGVMLRFPGNPAAVKI
jgi:hypothetical protein